MLIIISFVAIKLCAMKNLILYSAVIGGFAMVGCSSAYRTAQTPDDVYFSEGPSQNAVVRTNAKEKPEGYTSYWEKQDDDMLRMKVNNRDRWSQVDDIDYWQGYNNNYWVNYNTGFNSPWAMNNWNHMNMLNSPWGMNNWNSPWGMNAWNSPWGWNNGFNSGWGFNMGMGGFGFNRGLGFNSWGNSWNNPYCWNRPVTIINKYPVGSSRNASSLTPYTNYSYNRGANSMKSRTNVNPGTSRSIWDGGSTSNQSGNSRSNMYRSVERSGSGDSYSRPVRTFDGGGSSSGGSRSSGVGGGGSSSGGSSSGGSRGGRGG
jgi:hypothetical protein